MAKLITEYIDYSNLNIISETVDGKKSYMIEGPYLQSEIENKNKRKYSRTIVEREVIKFNQGPIKEGRSWMELDHPPSPTISLKNACGLIKELTMNGNDAIGKSKLIDTPNGRIASVCLESGGKLGVSSRGVGTIDKFSGYVNSDYSLVTVDVVANPSAPKSFVEGILESKEYIIGPDGDIVEAAVNQLQEQVDKDFSSKVILGYIYQFLNKIRNS